MQVIINADDFGINEVQTMAICEGFAKGIVTQTTAMTNMPWFDRARDLAKEKGFFGKVGLHFNLTEGVPLTDQMRNCRFFCDESGQFTANFHRSLKTRLVIPAYASDAVRAEAKAQIERYLAAGFTMLHLDSHHHAHTDFSIARILLPMARQYGFKTCRMSRTINDVSIGVVKSLYKTAFNRYARAQLGLVVDEFTNFKTFRDKYKTLKENCRVEVMVHPGLKGPEADPPMEEQMTFWKKADQEGVKICHD